MPVLDFTWAPRPEQTLEAVYGALADPDCDLHSKRIRVKEHKDPGLGRAVDRVVDSEGNELEQREVLARCRPYLKPYPGQTYCEDLSCMFGEAPEPPKRAPDRKKKGLSLVL